MKIIRIKESPKKLANMFMRFQEFYESPEFRGKVFSRKEFLAWYKESKGTIYSDDWAGFNLPGWVIEVFRHGTFDPLSADEKNLLKRCEGYHGSFYVIGTTRGCDDVNVLKHELAHAMFYLNDNYRIEAAKVINSLSKLTSDGMKKWLKSIGYHELAFVDEMQAYIVSDKPNKLATRAHQKLNLLYCKYVDDIVFC